MDQASIPSGPHDYVDDDDVDDDVDDDDEY